MKYNPDEVTCPHCFRKFELYRETEAEREMYVYDPEEDDEPAGYGTLYRAFALALGIILIAVYFY